MKQYIQYNHTTGRITATIRTLADAPAYEYQIIMEPPVEVEGKMVDLNTLKLIDIPPPANEEAEPIADE